MNEWVIYWSPEIIGAYVKYELRLEVIEIVLFDCFERHQSQNLRLHLNFCRHLEQEKA